MNKPPLGLKPRNIFLEERIKDIKRAINGYFENNQEVPANWIEEYNLICSELNKTRLVNWPPFDISEVKSTNGFDVMELTSNRKG